MAAAVSYPPLKLLKATYGFTEAKKVDVLGKLQLMARENNGVLAIDKKQDLNMLFSDPEPKASKKLTITYQYGDSGDVLTDEYNETRDTNVVYQAEDKPTDKMYGKMVITIHRAEELKNTETFGKMDPYYVLECGSEKFKSKVLEKAHTSPKWEEQHMLNLDGTVDILHLMFYSKHLISDTAAGRCDLPLGTLCVTTEPQWMTINEVDNFNKQAGKVLITATFKGRGGPRPREKKVAAAAAPVVQTVVVFATPLTPPSLPDLKAAPAKKVEAAVCHCDKGHTMVHHDDGDRCAYPCTGCGKNKVGSAGVHYQCQTCMLDPKHPATYWLCAECSGAAIATGYSPSAPLTAPRCDKNHACSDYTGRKPVGYHNEYKCDVCTKQFHFGQLVKYWHCDPCSFDCCPACGEKFMGAAAPAFKKVQCAKGHKMLPGWNKTPADAKGQEMTCERCHAKKRYTPQHDYYHCDQCKSDVCSTCSAGTATGAATAAAKH